MRLLIQHNQRLTSFQIFGASLLVIGVADLLFVSIYSFASARDLVNGDMPAVGFLLIMLGICLLFPDMLRSDPKSSVSTMRVAIFMIVIVFVFLTVKIAWSCKNMNEFNVDTTWGYILLAALGSKAVQSLGENWAMKNKPGTGMANPTGYIGNNKPNRSPGPPVTNNNPPNNNPNSAMQPPPSGPPSYFKNPKSINP